MVSLQSPLLFIIQLCVFLILSGCAVDKRPEVYSNSIKINAAFPAHGSSQNRYAKLQSALLSRNLLIADNGDVLPVKKNMCDANVLYRVTNANLPPYIGRHQDLYSGFYLDVGIVNGNWQVVSTDLDFTQLKAEFGLSLLATLLTPLTSSRDQFFIRPDPNASAESLNQLLTSVQGILPSKDTHFVVGKNREAQVKKAGFAVALTTANAGAWYLGPKLTSNAAYDRVFYGINQQANAEITAIVVSHQALSACVQVHNFILPPSQNFESNSKDNSLPNVVNTLPANADFNQLSRQQKLFKSGKYLTINGDVLKYSTYQKLQGTSRCSRLQPGDPLYRYCEDRKQDVSSEFKRRKATIRKQD